MSRLYFWRTRPELWRLLGVLILTYLLDLARRYFANEFVGIIDWKPLVFGLLVGGFQFVGSRFLAVYVPPGAQPPAEPTVLITPDGPVRRDEGEFRET